MVASSSPREAPTVPGLPLVGNLPELQRDPLKFFSRVHAEFGDYARVSFGPRRAVLVSDPAGIEHVLVKNVRNYGKQTRGYDVLRKLIGNGLVTSEGSFWLRQRRIAQPAFHRERVAGFADAMRRATADMIDRWAPKIGTGATVDVAAEMMRLTMRIAGETLLSTDVTAEAEQVGRAIGELLHQSVRRTQSLLFLPDVFPTPSNRRFKRSLRILDDVILGIIAERRGGVDKPDLLSMLMNATDEETGERMNDAQLRDEVMTMFIAGHETTANALAWTLHLLGHHPDVEERLRAEVRAVAADAPVSVEQTAQMPWLEAVLKESMRLYPPIWLLARSVIEDDVIEGVRVHAGDIVFLVQWVVHRHPALWVQPDAFMPERFLHEDEAQRARYAYFPFSGGPRKCIGDVFALLEAKIVLATLMQRVRVTPVPGHVVEPSPTVTLRPRTGVLCTLSAAPAAAPPAAAPR